MTIIIIAIITIITMIVMITIAKIITKILMVIIAILTVISNNNEDILSGVKGQERFSSTSCLFQPSRSSPWPPLCSRRATCGE